MSLNGIRWSFDTLRTATAAAITAGATNYVLVGTTFQHDASQLYLINFTDVPLLVSYDGVRDALFMPQASNHFNDIGSDRTNVSAGLIAPKGMGVWVKYIGVANPTTGNFYVSLFYAATP